MRLVEFVLPPNSSPSDPGSRPSGQELAAAEKLAPGLLSHFDDRNPGMHRSATTDMLYVISGRCVLELDDGSKTEISAGDVVVQSGTMHRWHNPSPGRAACSARSSERAGRSERRGSCPKTPRCRNPVKQHHPHGPRHDISSNAHLGSMVGQQGNVTLARKIVPWPERLELLCDLERSEN